jgi:hypothetical protein
MVRDLLLADGVEKPFSLMTENSQDRWCVSLAAM